MKKLLSILFAVACFASVASAQFVTLLSSGVVTNSGSTNLGAGSGLYIDCRYQDNVQVLLSYNNMVTACTSNGILRFIRAADASGTKDDTNWSGSITLACNGLSTVQVATNIAVSGVPYLKLTALENTNITALAQLTNVTIGYSIKQVGRALR
jgi:hypothetical protein